MPSSTRDVPKRIAVLMGTRPECIKLAPVVEELRSRPGLDPRIINTGQHRELLDDLLSPLRLRVDRDIGVMQPGQGLAALTARLVEAIDLALGDVQPAFALVQGDTSTVLAGALACFYRRVPFAHVEAGLRTGDLAAPFPEEANRLLAARLATLHFAPTERARASLLREGIGEERIMVTGNTGIDALLLELERQRDPAVATGIEETLARRLGRDWHASTTVVVTAHRRESFGDAFTEICAALAELADGFPQVRFVFPVHLNPNVQKPAHALLGPIDNIDLLPPLPYAEMVALLGRSQLVLTDSGGMQEEAPTLGRPVVVMRERTERPEGVEHGVAHLVGLRRERIVAEVTRLLEDPAACEVPAESRRLYGDGHAAARIVARVEEMLGG